MHSFLVSHIDLPEDQYHLHIHPDTSIGIDEVRRIHAFLAHKPPTSHSNHVVIHQAHLLTLPAQHALLKTLEEPPGDSQIYLITDYPDQLLPTILSRVQLNTKVVIQSEVGGSLSLFKTLLSSTVGDSLKLLESQKFTRQTLSDFLDQCELAIHHDLIHLSPLFPLIHQSKKYLKANCNLRLILTHLVCHL